jgi:hypothetical protein
MGTGCVGNGQMLKKNEQSSRSLSEELQIIWKQINRTNAKERIGGTNSIHIIAAYVNIEYSLCSDKTRKQGSLVRAGRRKIRPMKNCAQKPCPTRLFHLKAQAISQGGGGGYESRSKVRRDNEKKKQEKRSTPKFG